MYLTKSLSDDDPVSKYGFEVKTITTDSDCPRGTKLC